MKKILILLFLIFFSCMQAVFAEDEITSVNYDTSANMLFLTSSSKEAYKKQIKLVKLGNPNRVYFDIEDAVLSTQKQNFSVSSGGELRQVVISQNSTNPNVVRVVLYFAETYKTSQIKIFRIDNNIIVKLHDDICSQANYMNISYRDGKFENTDFYSFLTMTSQVIMTANRPLTQDINSSEKVLNQIQMAFENSTIPVNVKSSYQNTEVSVIKKDFKLRTRYYLKGIQAKQNGILLSGIGNLAIEKPLVLQNPARLVFDLPNTLSDKSLRTKVFKYGQDTVRVGQFEANKARIVITTPNPNNYIPIYSTDGQSVLIADKENLNHDKLTNIVTNLASTRYTQINDQNYGLNFYFTKPVVYSVKRTENNLTIYFFNAVQYNEQSFKSVIKSTEVANSQIYLMPKIGLRYSIPLDKQDLVKVYSGADARTIKVALSVPKKVVAKKIEDTPTTMPTKVAKEELTNEEAKIKVPKITRKKGEKVVVIDPGHGGIDYGAIRSGINEKDITTDVSNRVSAILKANGYKVHMTRSEDKTVSLQDRVTFTEDVAPDIFVSIHVNSSQGTTATGLETHYYHEYSLPLAKIVHKSLVSHVASKDRGLFKSRFYVINHTTMPAILVEIGFISNDNERAELVSEKRKQATAKAIAEGIMNYYKQSQK